MQQNVIFEWEKISNAPSKTMLWPHPLEFTSTTREGIALHPWPFVSDIAICVLKGDVKL